MWRWAGVTDSRPATIACAPRQSALSDAADLLGSGRPEASPDAFARLETALRA
jgi:hypothetical protein